MNASPAPRAAHHPSPIPLLRADHDVVLVHWPNESALREELAAAGRPRLLLVEVGAVPPLGPDPLEDWVRMPVPPEDLDVRRRVLQRRSLARTPIHLDDDGLLHRGRAWVALAPVELRLFTELYAAQGRVVSRAQLLRSLRPALADDDVRALDSSMLRVRRRVRPLGVVVHTVPRAGFLLELTDPEGDIL
jgi:hypothetical protein